MRNWEHSLGEKVQKSVQNCVISVQKSYFLTKFFWGQAPRPQLERGMAPPQTPPLRSSNYPPTFQQSPTPLVGAPWRPGMWPRRPWVGPVNQCYAASHRRCCRSTLRCHYFPFHAPNNKLIPMTTIIRKEISVRSAMDIHNYYFAVMKVCFFTNHLTSLYLNVVLTLVIKPGAFQPSNENYRAITKRYILSNDLIPCSTIRQSNMVLAKCCKNTNHRQRSSAALL